MRFIPVGTVKHTLELHVGNFSFLFDLSGQGALSSIWNLRSNVKYIQNLLEDYLGFIERWKNLLNWTHPRKTGVIYVGLIIGWLTLLVVPTRYLILCGGLYQFFYKFFPEQAEYPNVIRCDNLVASIPDDDDLRKAYHWETMTYQKKRKEQKQVRNNERETAFFRLRKCWHYKYVYYDR